MAATTAPQAARATSRPRTGLDRKALAILMPIGPLAIAVVRGILPYTTGDSNAVMAAKVAAHQGTETIVIWMTFVALLTLIPGVIALGLLARRHAPRLGTIGLVLAYAAFACLFWSSVAGSDTIALGAARVGMHSSTAGALITSVANIPPVGLGTGIFVLGHILSLVLLAIALWRGRVVPGWAALLLGGSQILHFVFAVIVPVQALDGCAWGLTAVAFAAAAVALTREPGPGQGRPAPQAKTINSHTEEHTMKSGLKSLTVLLAILGIGDLAMVPFMIEANHHNAGTPPVPAIVVGAIIGVATLASAFGVAQGRRWGFVAAMTCRIVDAVSSGLGVLAAPNTFLKVAGGIGFALSVAAIVQLIRLNPRRALRHAAAAR